MPSTNTTGFRKMVRGGLKDPLFFLAALVLSLLSAATVGAHQRTECEVKAAYLLNFAKFVDWPSKTFADEKAVLVIGILGDDPFGETLSKILKGQTAQGRNIEVKYFRAGEDYRACHLLFVSGSVGAQVDEIMQPLRGLPILTVSDKEGFVKQGGIIGLALVDNLVRFDINARAAAAAGLKPSSKLLALARSVVNSP